MRQTRNMARLLLFMLFCGCSPLTFALVALAPGEVSQPVGGMLQYLRDDDGRLDFSALQSRPATDWQQAEAGVFSRGYGNATWWLRFTAGNPAQQNEHQLLEIAYPVLDDVEVWVLHGGRTLAHYPLGDKHVFHARPIQHRFFLIPLQLPAGSERTVFLRVHSTSAMQVPLTLWSERAYFAQDQLYLLGQGIFFGGMGLMVLYSFFVFVALRDRTYLYYVLYVFSMMAFLASLKGFGFQFLWPEATQWNDRVLIVTLATTVVFGGLFTIRFLRIAQYLPRLLPFSLALAAAAAVIALCAFWLPYAFLIRVLIVVAALACLGFLVAGAWRWREGDRSARFYTIAWSSMLLGGVVLALSKFQLLPSNFFTENATQMGSAAEVILLSLAIADRITDERRQRYYAQQDALISERRVHEAQSQVLRAQREANEMLEQRVQVRTQELEVANRKLEELSATDQLTGIRNRRHLERVLQEEYARCHRYQHPLTLLLMDIDHFKRINDVWGHQVGDDCLRQVAAVLMDTVRTTIDHVARYGGEEFCVVMPETDADGAHIVAERIRAAIQAMPFEVNATRITVTISIGLAAEIPAAADASRELLRRADMALYQAKGDGRNRVVVA